MEARRTPALCRALVVLLIVATSAAVATAQISEKCWKDDDHHAICMPADCAMTCVDHGHVDGRCNWWSSWKPYCQCLVADCK